MSWNLTNKTFFFYHPFLCGELNLPYYRLSEEGQKIVQTEFNNYSPQLQKELESISQKVWRYSE